jgi:hypothetical protein
MNNKRKMKKKKARIRGVSHQCLATLLLFVRPLDIWRTYDKDC